MARIIGALLYTALLVGIGSGLLLFGGIGVFVTLPAALFVAIIAGLPAYFVLKKLGWLHWWQLALAGSALVSPIAFGMWPNFYITAAILFSGALAGLMFWWAGVAPNHSSKRTREKPRAA